MTLVVTVTRLPLDVLGVRGVSSPRQDSTFRSEDFMAYRHPVNKHKSAAKFRRNIHHTKAANMRAAPMRGGIRL